MLELVTLGLALVSFALKLAAPGLANQMDIPFGTIGIALAVMSYVIGKFKTYKMGRLVALVAECGGQYKIFDYIPASALDRGEMRGRLGREFHRRTGHRAFATLTGEEVHAQKDLPCEVLADRIGLGMDLWSTDLVIPITTDKERTGIEYFKALKVATYPGKDLGLPTTEAAKAKGSAYAGLTELLAVARKGTPEPPTAS